MKVGICEAQELKERGEQLHLTMAEVLWGYMLEDAMLRIYTSEYRDILWLENRNLLGEEAYRKRSEEKICFLYQPSERPIPQEKRCPGQKLSLSMCEQMIQDLFARENAREIIWTGSTSEQSGAFLLHLTGEYKDMQVPICIRLQEVEASNERPGKTETNLTVLKNKRLSYLIYAPENQLSKDLFEIINKLELIGDMGCYDRVYRMLCKESLSGRYVIEELNLLSENNPNVKREQRIEQLAGYEKYAYMRKRWEKYVRNRGVEPAAWEEVLHLLLQFLTPVWHSLCNNEIFFDDWMPELGRFLD